jgi:hypothetical protein
MRWAILLSPFCHCGREGILGECGDGDALNIRDSVPEHSTYLQSMS